MQMKDYGRAPTVDEQKIATFNGYKFLTSQFPPSNLEVFTFLVCKIIYLQVHLNYILCLWFLFLPLNIGNPWT